MPNIEIERKFLYSGHQIPHSLLSNTVSLDMVTQFYLKAEKDEEVRMHMEVNSSGIVSCYKTTKTGNGLERTEDIQEITEDEFGMALYESRLIPIFKCRISAMDAHTGLEIEIDTFMGELYGLRVVEVEFQSVEDSQSFKVPQWFGKEVTNDLAFKNKSLWRRLNKMEALR